MTAFVPLPALSFNRYPMTVAASSCCLYLKRYVAASLWPSRRPSHVLASRPLS